MSLLLDVSNVTSALGAALEIAAPKSNAYFQWRFEAVGNVYVEVALTASLCPEDADSNDLQPLPLSTTKKYVAGEAQSLAGSHFSGGAIKYDQNSANNSGIFYLENVPHIIVPNLYSLINGTYTGTWRMRLWGWA